MANSIDFRVKTGFFTHFKTGRLESLLGYEGVVKLLRLWGWAAENRPSGILTGMTGEDVEFAVSWNGPKGGFVSALTQIGWLDVMEDGVFRLHDWQEHNPWVAASPLRSDMGRMGKLASNYPEIYAKFAAAGIRSISKKDYEMEINAYKARKNGVSLSNSGYPCAPSPSPKTIDTDDQNDQQNYEDDKKTVTEVTAEPATDKKSLNNRNEKEATALFQNDIEDIPQNLIPKGMTAEEVASIRREVQKKPSFANLPPFLQQSVLRMTPFTIAREREKQSNQINALETRKTGSSPLESGRAFDDTFKKVRALYRSFPGYSPTRNEDEWLITLCQDMGNDAHSIIREARKWTEKRGIPVKNARGFVSRWVERVRRERVEKPLAKW
ncbi:MAG: hypothetical protein IJU98_08550 [Synergistaceae bacterium]|nr:hypothetical protein [Synergistaceae bacterium]